MHTQSFLFRFFSCSNHWQTCRETNICCVFKRINWGRKLSLQKIPSARIRKEKESNRKEDLFALSEIRWCILRGKKFAYKRVECDAWREKSVACLSIERRILNRKQIKLFWYHYAYWIVSSIDDDVTKDFLRRRENSNSIEFTRRETFSVSQQSDKRKSILRRFSIHSLWIMALIKYKKGDFLSKYSETVAIYSKDVIRWITIAARIKIAGKIILWNSAMMQTNAWRHWKWIMFLSIELSSTWATASKWQRQSPCQWFSTVSSVL